MLGFHEWGFWFETENSKYEQSPFDQWFTRECFNCDKIQTKDKMEY